MSSKVIKLEIGTVYQKTKNGNYYFRYQVKGQRKAVSLKTKNRQKALNKAQALIPILKASSTEIISAHVHMPRALFPKRKAWNCKTHGKFIQNIPVAQLQLPSRNKQLIEAILTNL